MKELLEEREAGTEASEIADRLRAWIAALRSGKYTQCENYLHDAAGGYCCLGVALEVRGVEWEPGTYSFMPSDNPRRYGAPTTSLSDENAALFGLIEDDRGTLIAMNDVEHKTFPEIADYIESTILPRHLPQSAVTELTHASH